MGVVTFGIPEREADYLKNALNLDVFVEGGTYLGGTAKNMSQKFRKVYTIEKSAVMHGKAKKELAGYSNITLIKGDTRNHLKKILEHETNILFWLDAHWSGGDTYGENDECPLIEELETIFSFEGNNAILIDDARLFLAPPPSPHDFQKWPSLVEIIRVIPSSFDVLVHDDVIYIFPTKIANGFKLFLQGLITNRVNKKESGLANFFRKVEGYFVK